MSYEKHGMDLYSEIGTASVRQTSGNKESISVSGESPSGYETVSNRSTTDYKTDNLSSKARVTTALRIATSRQSAHDALQRLLNKTGQVADYMVRAAQDGDLIELSIIGFELYNCFEDLWKLRDEREADWRDLLSLSMCMMAKEKFEQFTVKQCQVIKKIIESYLQSKKVNADDIEHSIDLLHDAGFDPWKGISSR